MFNPTPNPQRQFAHAEEKARQRSQRSFERAERMRKVHGDGPNHEWQRSPLVLVASLVAVALAVLVVLVLTGIVHL